MPFQHAVRPPRAGLIKIGGMVYDFLGRQHDFLATGHRVELRGFGAFSVKTRPSRMGRNPRTGEPVSVGQKRAPFFRTGKELRERLNITKAPE